MRLLLFSLLVFVIGCDVVRDCLEPDDHLVKETLRKGNFESLSVNVSGEVMYIHSDEPYLLFEGPENYFNALNVTVKNGKLIIDADRCFARSTGYYFQIGAPDLSAVSLNGQGRFVGTSNMGKSGSFKVTLNGSYDFSGVLETENFTGNVNGQGDLTLGGKANKASVQIIGAGNYSGLRMETKSTDISINGAGSAYVYATDALNVKITGAGSVNYVGHPEVSRSILGSGKIIDAN